MVKFSHVSRARPHSRRVLGRCPRVVGLENRVDKGSVSMQFRVSGAVEAAWDAGWQVFGHVGSRSWAEAVRAPPLHEKCTCWYAPCLKAFVPSPRAQVGIVVQMLPSSR